MLVISIYKLCDSQCNWFSENLRECVYYKTVHKINKGVSIGSLYKSLILILSETKK
jgi:hypothetical protein